MRFLQSFIFASALCLCLAACLPVMRSEHPKLSGTVTDAVTGKPIASVTVTYLSMNDVSTVTDAEGRYELPGKNYLEIAFVSQEGPMATAVLEAAKPGYLPDMDSMIGRQSGPDTLWTADMRLLPESHPVAPYAQALKKSVDAGGRYDDWLVILHNMRGAGLSRKDALLMWECAPYIFHNLSRTPDTNIRQEEHRLREVIHTGGEVWPLTER